MYIASICSKRSLVFVTSAKLLMMGLLPNHLLVPRSPVLAFDACFDYEASHHLCFSVVCACCMSCYAVECQSDRGPIDNNLLRLRCTSCIHECVEKSRSLESETSWSSRSADLVRGCLLNIIMCAATSPAAFTLLAGSTHREWLLQRSALVNSNRV